MAHTFAQQCVEITQRFVQEEGVRLANERSSNRDTLTLSSAQLAWLLSQQIADFQHRRSLMNAPIDFRRRHLFQTEIEGEVLIARHVWVERVRLKYHRHVALSRRYGFDGYAVHANPARGQASRPAISRSNVDFPQPEGPTTVKISRSLISRDKLSRATIPRPNSFETFSRRMTGM